MYSQWRQMSACKFILSDYENTPIQIHWKFYHQKMAIFQIKNSDIFVISAQNIEAVLTSTHNLCFEQK